MSDKCPICKTNLTEKISTQTLGNAYDCPRCGRFIMHSDIENLLPRLYDMERGKNNEEKSVIISHAIRKMSENEPWPPTLILGDNLIGRILKNPLPSLPEQADNLIRWYAENVSPGKDSFVDPSTFQSIIGAKNSEGVALIVKYLLNRGLLDGSMGLPGEQIWATLSFKGWQYYDQLKRGSVGSRKAFMAMKFGDETLNKIVDDVFKPAVAQTGFNLFKLDDEPKAGLIDDRLRVEIQTSRFLIADLTHENAGAYWEAGYAEGLGKAVIYTCEKEKFERAKTHFDTNHHLTIPWEADKLKEAAENLKATIRATLPDEAKLTDNEVMTSTE